MPYSPLKPKGRLAPSPTGELHLGHAFSFIHAYWQMRRLGGDLILRQEDLDVSRSSQAAIDATRFELTWLGLSWNEERLQSATRQRIINAALELKQQGCAYYCSCTRGDLKALGAPHSEGEIPYPGVCKEKQLALGQSDTQTLALRFIVPKTEVTFTDLLQGRFSSNPHEQVGDFPILRKDGSPAYQLAVVVDDHFDEITHVLRGADLLVSTGRQLLLQGALGYSPPLYAHIPLIADAQGTRLAKRHDSLSLRTLREAGVRPSTIINWVAEISGLRDAPQGESDIDAWVNSSESIYFNSPQARANNLRLGHPPFIHLPEQPLAFLLTRQRQLG